jgi:hypothetical protein
MTRQVGTDVQEHPLYDGTSDLDNVLQNMEETMGEDQSILVLDISFQNTPARWWATHKDTLRTWDEVKQALKYRFWNREQLESEMQTYLHVAQLFSGESNPRIQIQHCVA